MEPLGVFETESVMSGTQCPCSCGGCCAFGPYYNSHYSLAGGVGSQNLRSK